MAITAGALAAMTAASAAGSALGGLGNSAISAYQQKKLAAYQAKLNYKYAEKQSRNQPTWNRAGLEAAGFNPMLAVQNSTSGANSSWTSAQSSQSPNLDTALSTGISQAIEARRLSNENATTAATVASNEATARNQIAEAVNREIESKYVDDKLKSEIANTSAATTKLTSDTEMNNAVMENMKSRLELDRQVQDWQKNAAFMGLDVQKRGQNLSYASNIYNSDSILKANKYSSDTSERINKVNRGFDASTIRLPFGTSFISDNLLKHYGVARNKKRSKK